MSGGSLDYADGKIIAIAERLNGEIGAEKNLIKRDLIEKLQAHLYELAEILHELEWYWSGDTGDQEYEDVLIRIKRLNLQIISKPR